VDAARRVGEAPLGRSAQVNGGRPGAMDLAPVRANSRYTRPFSMPCQYSRGSMYAFSAYMLNRSLR